MVLVQAVVLGVPGEFVPETGSAAESHSVAETAPEHGVVANDLLVVLDHQQERVLLVLASEFGGAGAVQTHRWRGSVARQGGQVGIQRPGERSAGGQLRVTLERVGVGAVLAARNADAIRVHLESRLTALVSGVEAEISTLGVARHGLAEIGVNGVEMDRVVGEWLRVCAAGGSAEGDRLEAGGLAGLLGDIDGPAVVGVVRVEAYIALGEVPRLGLSGGELTEEALGQTRRGKARSWVPRDEEISEEIVERDIIHEGDTNLIHDRAIKGHVHGVRASIGIHLNINNQVNVLLISLTLPNLVSGLQALIVVVSLAALAHLAPLTLLVRRLADVLLA
mmetsp:Transcript_27352/g.55958  ORF Transcript_27352/g.55958 Transcript_27352/m.55958 type:complete len:336 (+) Transcript_27352:628-1635(+)